MRKMSSFRQKNFLNFFGRWFAAFVAASPGSGGYVTLYSAGVNLPSCRAGFSSSSHPFLTSHVRHSPTLSLFIFNFFASVSFVTYDRFVVPSLLLLTIQILNVGPS